MTSSSSPQTRIAWHALFASSTWGQSAPWRQQVKPVGRRRRFEPRREEELREEVGSTEKGKEVGLDEGRRPRHWVAPPKTRWGERSKSREKKQSLEFLPATSRSPANVARSIMKSKGAAIIDERRPGFRARAAGLDFTTRPTRQKMPVTRKEPLLLSPPPPPIRKVSRRDDAGGQFAVSVSTHSVSALRLVV